MSIKIGRLLLTIWSLDSFKQKTFNQRTFSFTEIRNFGSMDLIVNKKIEATDMR